MELICRPPQRPYAIMVDAERNGDRLHLRYRPSDPARLRLTDSPPARTDGLWRHTCFEAFVAGSGAEYCEFNFAPSGAWAGYAFDVYRTGMRDLATSPVVAWQDGALSAEVAVPVEGDWRLNLTAVIEEIDGTKSYWALAHPDGPPDFHDAACFVLTLPAE